jgi:hypothetical protein
MKLWDDIVNKAMLGSSKLQVRSTDLPEAITTVLDVQDSDDSEENFLRFTSLIYQFRQAGALPRNLQTIAQPPSETETKPYAPEIANEVLKTVLEENLFQFLQLWLARCDAKGLCIAPELMPRLLDEALENKELRKVVVRVCGKRGEWLSRLNPQWNFNEVSLDPTTLWETGKPDERKQVLRELRQTNPNEALNLLQRTWNAEGANEKVAFLEILENGLSAADLSWLESLKEKSQRVSSAILDLLKAIPASTVVQAYGDILKKAVNLKKGKALLGLVNKETIEINHNFPFPDSVFKSGIEKLSSDKNVSDQQFIFAQLVSSVPPSFWNDHFKLPTDVIIGLFQKDKQTAFYVPALAMAAIKFKDVAWIRNLLDHGDAALMNSSIVPLVSGLNGKDRDTYAQKFFQEDSPEMIQLMLNSVDEWSMNFAKLVLQYTAGDVYLYNRSFYRQAAALIPVEILDQLESFTPTDELKKTYWKNQTDELARLLTTKQSILQSFKS